MAGRTARRRVLRISQAGGAAPRADLLAAEEPLGIRIGGQPLTLTMRTPGDDLDLVAGFLLSEGIVASAADIAELRICSGERCGHDHEDLGNVADVTLAPGIALRPGQRRNFLTSSACGVCGKTSIAELSVSGNYDLSRDAARVTPEVLAGLPDALRAAQRVFDRTGGLHAAG
ncbi:MAG: formate dehydrogenase accessory sulfurtransferase FdhD, partial [Actinomycetota bacterium]|nr:formate dehydrogenase accessory sulfurtransferase FdhD [Actinomycetota bacterium]